MIGNLGRLWRTGRHLKPEQLAAALVRRLRHERWRRWPKAAHASIASAAAALPLPQLDRPALQRVAGPVQLLQSAIHPRGSFDLARARFTFLGRTVEFGSPERIAWRCDLGENNSPLWRLTLAYFGWAVPLLADGSRESLKRIADCLRHMEHEVDWAKPNVFRDIWNPYTASHRLINLLSGLALGHRSHQNAADGDLQLILHHIRFCAAFIAHDLETDLQLNHLLKNYVALAAYTASIETLPLSWGPFGAQTRESIEQNFLADGGHAERSAMYHVLGLLDLHILRDCGAVPTDWHPILCETIDAAEHALSVLQHPDGDIALFNDAWIGGAPPTRHFGRVLPIGRHDLSTTGYSRLDGGQDVALLDCGSIGPDFNPAHGHADFLAIEASISGTRFIVDPGTPTYTAGHLREWSRSAAAHNGPMLIDEEPVEFWRSFRVGRRAKAGLLRPVADHIAPLSAAGWHDGYRHHGFEMRRWLGLWPGQALVIVDSWPPAAAGRAVSNFLIPAHWRPAAEERLRLEGLASVAALPLAGELSPSGPANHWRSYGVEESALRLMLRPGEGGLAAVAFIWGREPNLQGLADAVGRTLREAAHVDNAPAMAYGKRP